MYRILKLYPQFTQLADRNNQNDPAFDNQCPNSDSNPSFDTKLTQDIHKIKDTVGYLIDEGDSFVRTVKKFDNVSKKKPDLSINVDKIALAALCPLTPIRRISSLKDNIDDGNYQRAAGLVALAIVNLPEDSRDLKDAWDQVVHGKLPSYNFKNCQTPFAFFRGTALEPIVNKMGKVGVFLHKWDIPLSETKFGRFLIRKLNIDINIFDREKTGRSVPQVIIDDSGKSIIRRIDVFAYKMKVNHFQSL